MVVNPPCANNIAWNNNTITDNTVSNDFAANDIPWGTED